MARAKGSLFNHAVVHTLISSSDGSAQTCMSPASPSPSPPFLSGSFVKLNFFFIYRKLANIHIWMSLMKSFGLNIFLKTCDAFKQSAGELSQWPNLGFQPASSKSCIQNTHTVTHGGGGLMMCSLRTIRGSSKRWDTRFLKKGATHPRHEGEDVILLVFDDVLGVLLFAFLRAAEPHGAGLQLLPPPTQTKQTVAAAVEGDREALWWYQVGKHHVFWGDFRHEPEAQVEFTMKMLNWMDGKVQ